LLCFFEHESMALDMHYSLKSASCDKTNPSREGNDILLHTKLVTALLYQVT